MSWIKFKETYLFGVNFSIMVGAILYAVRKDWSWHPAVGFLLVISMIFPVIISQEKKLLHVVGKINSFILLTSFYFLFFTPFSFAYRLFFRNAAFIRASSRFVIKKEISSFEQPF